VARLAEQAERKWVAQGWVKQSRTNGGAIAMGADERPHGKSGGVLVAALQSEREEETRDRAERGSAVRGSDQASVAAERTPPDAPA